MAGHRQSLSYRHTACHHFLFAKAGADPVQSLHRPPDRQWPQRLLKKTPKLPPPRNADVFFSASKITAVVMHILAEEGKVNLLDPVSHYLPEFGQTESEIPRFTRFSPTRGGIPRLAADTQVEILWNEDEVWRLLCEAKPISSSGE